MISFGTLLIIPLIGVYVLKYSIPELKNALLFFVSFFILAFVPYELGLLDSIETGYNLEQYGSDISGAIGPFQTVHSASMALGGSFLVVLYFILDKAFNRLYLSMLLILCFYFLFSTYVRTGMAMATVGSMPIVYYFGKKELSTRIRLIFIGGLVTFMVSTWVLSNEILLNRITGKTQRGEELDSVETMGSGRGSLWQYAIEVYLESNVVEQLIGLGPSETLIRMSGKAHHKVFPHNGFLQILLGNGLIGLISLVYYMRKIYGIRRKTLKEHFVLINGMLFAYFTMTLFQNHELLYFHILMMISIAMFVQKSFIIKK
ncbi:O-antigen ligase family protein [Winogradskyella sp. SM1960]|uniref:O-antigen ligase family protein n=1 Tax=Winogradskyella sp. SM1960 TaxID=2865955 RepID=UPI001CD2E7D9|nr:O-antigen ligase family protein [Winogradskyella sp. SM1960]